MELCLIYGKFWIKIVFGIFAGFITFMSFFKFNVVLDFIFSILELYILGLNFKCKISVKIVFFE